MEKDDLVKKHYNNLKMLEVDGNTLGGFTTNYKELQKQTKPEWPKIMELVTKQSVILNFKKCQFKPKDMETFAFMLANNPYGESKITSLNLG